MFAKATEHFRKADWPNFEAMCNIIYKMKVENKEESYDPKVVMFCVFCFECMSSSANEVLFAAHRLYRFGLNSAISTKLEEKILDEKQHACLLPLHGAIRNDNIPLVEFLLEHGSFLDFPLSTTIAHAQRASVDTFCFILDMVYFDSAASNPLCAEAFLTLQHVEKLYERGANLVAWKILAYCKTRAVFVEVETRFRLTIDEKNIVSLVLVSLGLSNFVVAEHLLLHLSTITKDIPEMTAEQYDASYDSILCTTTKDATLRTLFAEKWTQLVKFNGKSLFTHLMLNIVEGASLFDVLLEFGKLAPKTQGKLSFLKKIIA